MMFSQRLMVILMFIGCKYHSLSLISTAYAVSVNYTRQDVLNPQDYHAYITRFNSEDDELYQQHIPNHDSWRFLERNIPLFDCPDKELEMTYYFRWWTYRKHIKRVDAVYNSSDAVESTLKYVITEFLPNVSWSGKFNTISAAAAHHIKGFLILEISSCFDFHQKTLLTYHTSTQYLIVIVPTL